MPTRVQDEGTQVCVAAIGVSGEPTCVAVRSRCFRDEMARARGEVVRVRDDVACVSDEMACVRNQRPSFSGEGSWFRKVSRLQPVDPIRLLHGFCKGRTRSRMLRTGFQMLRTGCRTSRAGSRTCCGRSPIMRTGAQASCNGWRMSRTTMRKPRGRSLKCRTTAHNHAARARTHGWRRRMVDW